MAPILFVKKVLYFSTDKRLELAMKGAFEKNGYQIEKEVSVLSSLDSIRKIANTTNSITFVRTNLVDYFKKQGVPQFICIDFSIDLQLKGDHSNDHQKLLKTLLITYLLLSMGAEYKDLHVNIVLIANNNQKLLAAFKQFPMKILDLLVAKDEKINEYIKNVKSNDAIFNRIFSIVIVEKSMSPHNILELITTRIKGLKDKE